MNPWIIASAVAGVGYLAYKHLKVDTGFQSVNTTAPNGSPLTITTPIPEQITFAQASGIPDRPPTVGQYYPVPMVIPGHGTTFAPPATVHYDTIRRTILQHAPIVLTNTGVASIAVGTVKDVQHSLNALGYCKPPLVEDGKLGPKTLACIKAFQGKNGLVVDGTAGAALKAALSAALTHMAGSNSVTGATIKNSRPETGVVVSPAGATINTAEALKLVPKTIQHILNVLGASPPLVEDGKVGPKTVAAIKSFQTAHGLVPDGVAGPKVKTALYLASTALQPQAFMPWNNTITMPAMKVTA